MANLLFKLNTTLFSEIQCTFVCFASPLKVSMWLFRVCCNFIKAVNWYDMTGNIESDSDDQWLEDEIQHELDQLDENCLLTDDEQSSHESSLENHSSPADAKVIG